MSKILKFDKFFEEASLTIPELNKDAKNPGDKRGDVLINKIKNKEKVKLIDNTDVQITKMSAGPDNREVFVKPDVAIKKITTRNKFDVEKSKKYFKKGNNYTEVFKDKDGNEYTIKSLKKTAEFGSSGAGTDVRNFESLQCLFLAFRQSNGPLSRENIFDIFRQYTNNEDVIPQEVLNNNLSVYLPDIKITQEMLDNYSEDWISTFFKIPNKLWDNTYINTDLKYKIYHIGCNDTNSPHKILFDFFTLVKKKSRLNVNFMKWCPADVYLIESESIINFQKSIEHLKISSPGGDIWTRDEAKIVIDDLNRVVNDFFDRNLLVPISLKKIKGDNFKIITNMEHDKFGQAEIPNFIITKLKINDGLLGKSSEVIAKSEWKHKSGKSDKMERILKLRSCNRKGNINGEVEGSSSRHGKVALSEMNRILVNYDVQVQTYKELAHFEDSELEEMVVELISEISNYNSPMVKVEKSGRGAKNISGNKDALISRLQSLQMIKYLYKIYIANRGNANSIITKIMRHALSIQTGYFDTPRYLRVL